MMPLAPKAIYLRAGKRSQQIRGEDLRKGIDQRPNIGSEQPDPNQLNAHRGQARSEEKKQHRRSILNSGRRLVVVLCRSSGRGALIRRKSQQKARCGNNEIHRRTKTQRCVKAIQFDQHQREDSPATAPSTLER